MTLASSSSSSSSSSSPNSSRSRTSSPPTTLRIITLNCWGLKYISTHRHARLVAIGHALAAASPAPDVVALQECWTQRDYLAIRALTSHLLPHAKYYFSGIFGGGLALLSRFPIEQSSMQRYALNGRPTAFFRGDWFVGKGVARATLRLGPGDDDVLEVLNTHLHAPYEREPNDSYLCHRTAQAWELAKLLRAASHAGRLAIALGDFNMLPLSLAHRIVTTYGAAADAWRVLHPHSAVGAAEDAVERARGRDVPSVDFNVRENGTTCDSEACTWRWDDARRRRLDRGENVGVDMAIEDVRGKRLDYIFVSGGSVSGNDRGTPDRAWTVQDIRVGMMHRHPTLHCSLSDHFSVEATLALTPASTPTPASNPHPPRHHRQRHLPTTILDQILAVTHLYSQRERRQRRLRVGHFALSLLVSAACLAGVRWCGAPAPSRPWLALALALVSTLNLAAGVLDGLIGGLFVGAEMRALWEFEWEVRNARSMAVEAEAGAETEAEAENGGRAEGKEGMVVGMSDVEEREEKNEDDDVEGEDERRLGEGERNAEVGVARIRGIGG